ncbi:uncharacterized protein M421DRAFT_396640 [Didymella exigua CBS 183.55]|uniref:Uncharacterized protein n=1 Tax=Didymella exigua CBS 183.55 TaxID=1150837 RepID=A0A6A5RDJ9_9PLEO|nr:uncharacterized protein M421DRAFT_396640 [Didymella exigua CBS 183.55]KAF1926341.1 hypothetical protein M421DRAFT_396640 [Didymella exigua CBS 183.55]
MASASRPVHRSHRIADRRSQLYPGNNLHRISSRSIVPCSLPATDSPDHSITQETIPPTTGPKKTRLHETHQRCSIQADYQKTAFDCSLSCHQTSSKVLARLNSTSTMLPKHPDTKVSLTRGVTRGNIS